LDTAIDRAELIDLIHKRILDYAIGRPKLIYNYMAALLLVKGVENYSNFSMNGAIEDIEVPTTSVLKLEVILT